MVRSTILILEDDATRLRDFETAVSRLGAPYRLRSWRDAQRMIAECHEDMADVALISLDHDLNKENPDSPDPGTGLEVATFLAHLPCLCPVILHTSNGDRVWSMHNELRFGGWNAERVMPLGVDWITTSWISIAQKLLGNLNNAPGKTYFKPIQVTDQRERFNRALLSLHGLAIGDGIGEMMAGARDRARRIVEEDDLPSGPWFHTDDTEMAISIVETLRLMGRIDQDCLSRQFVWRYERNPDRGYGSGARKQLRMVLEGADWRAMSRDAFGGLGSLGNGSAMRVAPIGAWYADDLNRVVEEARVSSEVTHVHSEGVAGAIAIAVAAAMAYRLRGKSSKDAIEEFFDEVHKHTPDGETRRGISKAYDLLQFESPEAAGRILGSGFNVTCPDTVPFAVWSAAKHLGDFRGAIAATASVDGDVDTNCAIVGGIVALSTGWEGIPVDWLKQIEPLPYLKR